MLHTDMLFHLKRQIVRFRLREQKGNDLLLFWVNQNLTTDKTKVFLYKVAHLLKSGKEACIMILSTNCAGEGSRPDNTKLQASDPQNKEVNIWDKGHARALSKFTCAYCGHGQGQSLVQSQELDRGGTPPSLNPDLVAWPMEEWLIGSTVQRMEG